MVFVIGWGILIPNLAVLTIIGFLALLAIFALIWYKIPGIAIDIFLLSLVGGLIAAYVQLLFLNGSLFMLTTDTATQIEISRAMLIVNLLIFLVITLFPLTLWLVLRKTYVKYEKIVLFMAVLIFGMQTAGLIGTVITTELPPGVEKDKGYLIYDPIMELGNEDNIIVFLLDYMDVLYMDELLDAYPEIYDQLDGFTYYKNNISEYNATFPTITTMLTNHRYSLGMLFSEYFEDAWANHSALDDLWEVGYDINLLIDRYSTYWSVTQLEGIVNNTTQADLSISYPGMSRIMCTISVLRIAPYIVKNIFIDQVPIAFGNYLFSIVSPYDVQWPIISPHTDLDFYHHITKNDMTVIENKKVFNFIHLNFAHFSNEIVYNKETGIIEYGGDRLDSKRANFKMIELYLNKMKDKGIFNSATIMIIGDHGCHIRHVYDNEAVTTGLLIKQRDATGKLEIDSVAELTNKYFGASVLEFADLSHENFGISFFDIINQRTAAPLRQMTVYLDWWKEDQIDETYAVFEITGNANDFTNWRRID